MESCFWTYRRVGVIQIQLFMKFLEVDRMSLLFGLMQALQQYRSNLLGKIIYFKINSSHFGPMISVTASQVQSFMMCRDEYAIFWTYSFQHYGIGPKMSHIKRQLILSWIYAACLGVIGPKSCGLALDNFFFGCIRREHIHKSKVRDATQTFSENYS